MTSILPDILLTLKSSSSLADFEQQFIQQMSQMVCQLLSATLEQLDQELCLGSHDFTILRKDQRRLTFTFGDVCFQRRLVADRAGQHYYPLDETLKLNSRVRFSPYLMAQVVTLASSTVMRVTANAVKLLTPVSISHTEVDHLVRVAGEQVDQTRKAEADYAVPEQSKRRVVPHLFIEADAFETKLKDGGQTLVHRIQISEGVVKNGQRHQLIKRHVMTNLSHQQVFTEAQSYLDQHYDLRQTTVLTGSDNGVGYRPDNFSALIPQAKEQHHILDGYHLNRKIKERLKNTPLTLEKKLRKAVWTGNKKLCIAVLDTAESILAADDHTTRDQLQDIKLLRRYLKRNWGYILPLSDQTLNRQGLGGCESNHRRYTYRLKHQGKSWTKAGLAAELRIIDALQNKNLEMTLKQSTAFEVKFQPQLKQRISQFLKAAPTMHSGAVNGRITLADSSSSALGFLAKAFN